MKSKSLLSTAAKRIRQILKRQIHRILSTMLCCGCRKENIGAHSQRILGEGAGMYATYPQPVQYYQPGGQPATLRRVVQLPMGVGPAPGIHHQHPQHHGQHPNHALHHGQVTYGTLNAARQPARMPEMVLQSDFRKVSGISSEMFRQIEAIEKEYDPQTASLIEAAERRGEMIIRLLDPRNLGRAGVEAGRRYLAMSIDGQTVQFVEIIKSPGQTLGLYIREGDGIRTTEGVFISRIAPESPIYNSGVLKIGDEILAVNLVDVRRMSLDDVVIVMSIPRRLVLTIRSQLFMPGMASNAATLRRQAQYADEYRQPVVIVKKELQDDAYGSEDVNSMRDSENGQLIHARLKGLPTNMPPVAVALEGEESLYEEAAMYYSAQPLRNTLRPMSRARDDTYVQIYQKAVDARLRPMGIVSNQPQTLQRAYPGTLDNLAGHTMNYHDMMSRRPPLPVSRMAMSRPSSALSHRPASAMGRQRFWDDLNSGPARRSHQRTLSGGDHGLPPTVSDDFLERYSRPLSRSSVRTPSGGYPSVVDMRNKRYDDLRSSMSSQALAALRRRAAADGSVSDTEASTRPTYGLKHHIPESKYTSRLSGRSSAMDSLRSNSLPRPHRSGLSDYRSKQHSGHLRRSSSRNQTQPIRLDRSLYDEDSDGANSAPEMPDKPRRHLGPRNVMPSSHHDYSSEDYRQWLTRAPSTSAIYDTVRRLGRPSSTLPPGIASSNSLSKIAHSAESLLDTLRLEHQKNLLADLYANRAAIVAAGRSLSPTSSVTLNQRHTNAVSPDSLALKMARHGRPQLMPHQPSAMDYLKGTIPHPTPVKPCEDGRMNLLTLNPREFFKYRYEKPTGGQPQGIGRQMSTSDSLVTIPDQANIPGLPQPSLDSVHQHRDHMGFSGIIWIHLLAGRGLRASSSTGGPSAVPVTSTATSTAASSNGQQSVASVGEGPGVNRDLYCVIECDRVHRARTVVRSGESSFDWDEIFELDLVDCKEVSFLLYSWDPQYRHKLCYKGIINLVSLSLDSTPVHSLALKMEPRGTLYIKMRYKEPNSTFQRTPSATPLPTTLFGVDVESVVNRERSGSNVPLLIKRSIEEIEKRGLELVGIYRLCGSAVRKKMLREAFEKNVWLVDLTAEHVPDINVITSLVKDYLRELPEPLFTKALFEMMVDGLSVCLPDDPAGNAKLMFSILECLPKIDRCCVMFLMDHLKLVTKHSEKNKMTSQALAAIFGPLFTCSTESDNLHKSVEVFKFLLDIWPSRKGSILSRNASIDETVQSKDSSNSSNMPVTSSTVSSSNINNTSAAHSAAASIVSKAAPHGPSRSLQQQQQMQGSSLYTSASMPVHSVTSSGIDSLPVTTLTPGASPTALEPMMSPTDGQPTPSVQPRPRVSVYGQDNAPHNVQSSQSMVHSTTKKSVAWASGPSSTGTPTTRILLGNTGLSQGSHQGAPANLNNRS